MILNKRNQVRSKNMVLQNNNNSSIQLGQTLQISSPDNFSINSSVNYKKKYQKLGFNQMNPLTNFNANVNENTKEKNTVLNLIPKWFDWKYYLDAYQDLRDAGIATEQDAYTHWIVHGKNESRECMKNHSLFKQYPNLFHKYLLGLSKSENPMSYEIISETDITKKFICSIHCYDLSNFHTFFNVYISKLSTFFDFVVTYINDVNNIRLQYNFTFIKMQNKGMDLGSKFITVDYLKNKNVDYSYIFFIHSKSNTAFRKKYMQEFIKNLHEIIRNMESSRYDGIFNSMIHNSNGNWSKNATYMNDVISYLNLDTNYFVFPEGNFYILSKEVCELMFSDIKIYNCLNATNDFDYSWVKNYYNLQGNYNEIYNIYTERNLYGNNLETNLGHSALADCMIEHVFERIVFLILLKYNKTLFIYKNSVNYKMNKNINKLSVSVIACHSSNQTKINTIVNNIYYLNEISDVIHIIDTDSFSNNNLIASIQDTYPDACINCELTNEKTIEYISENPDLCNFTIDEAKEHFKIFGFKESNRLSIFSHFIFVSYCENVGFCYGKWLNYFEKIDNSITNHNYILSNDSFLITNKLNKFNNLISENKYDVVSMLASNQFKYHYTDFLRCYNNTSIKEYISFIKKELSISNGFSDVIQNIEIPSVNLFFNKACVYDAEPGYDGNINFDNNKLFHYLNDLDYPIVKIKKINSNFYNDANLPEDFEGESYKRIHADLINIPDPVEHFLHCGIPEGRIYKQNQVININPQLKEYLSKYAENNRNICKIDFKNYTA